MILSPPAPVACSNAARWSARRLRPSSVAVRAPSPIARCRREPATSPASRSAARSCPRTARVVYRPAASPVSRSCSASRSAWASTLPFTASRSASSRTCLDRYRSSSRPVKVALLRVSASSTRPGSRAAAAFSRAISSSRAAASDPGARIRTGPTCTCGTASGASTRSASPCPAKYRSW